MAREKFKLWVELTEKREHSAGEKEARAVNAESPDALASLEFQLTLGMVL